MDYKDLSEYNVKYRIILRERLSDIELLKGSRVICLGARRGTEVRVFWDLGSFAFGIDINPGKDNPYVSCGDFHNLQFPSNSADIVFTNSLDHVFNIETVISEIKRVLKPNGLLIIEAVKGEKEGGVPGFWESFWWERIDDLVSLFEKNQFKIIRRKEFDYPWEGEQIILGYEL